METAQDLRQDWNFVVFGEHTEKQKAKWLWHERTKRFLLLKVSQMSLQGVANLLILLSCSINIRNERQFFLQGRLQHKQNTH